MNAIETQIANEIKRLPAYARFYNMAAQIIDKARQRGTVATSLLYAAKTKLDALGTSLSDVNEALSVMVISSVNKGWITQDDANAVLDQPVGGLGDLAQFTRIISVGSSVVLGILAALTAPYSILAATLLALSALAIQLRDDLVAWNTPNSQGVTPAQSAANAVSSVTKSLGFNLLPLLALGGLVFFAVSGAPRRRA